jgi:8-oxo-dGTP diphosphatase
LYSYPHPRPSVAVDILLFRKSGDHYQILLVKRALDPYRGRYALPGGFVEIDESLEDAAKRELSEETGLGGIQLSQIHTFSDPDRDPRGRVISTAFGGLMNEADLQTLLAGSDAAEASWFPITELPQLAFDHLKIIQVTIQKMNLPGLSDL